MFAKTEFERQHRLLKHALGLLIIFAFSFWSKLI